MPFPFRALFVALITLTALPAFAFDFPPKLAYKVTAKGQIAEATLSFSRQSPEKGTSVMQLSDFQGLGIKSNERMVTLLDDADLSLYAAFLMKGDTTVYEIRRTNEPDPMNREAVTFQFKEPGAPRPTNTITYSDYPVVDLLGMFIYLSKKVADGNMAAEKLNLWVNKTTKIVDVESMGSEEVQTGFGRVEAQRLAVSYQGTPVFSLWITQAGNYWFPAELSLETEGLGTIRMVADAY